MRKIVTNKTIDWGLLGKIVVTLIFI